MRRRYLKRSERQQKKNLLWRTRTYLVGPMENVTAKEGQNWRERLTPHLKKMGVIVFNPYNKPFMTHIDEGKEAQEARAEAKKLGHFNKICKDMRVIRSFDLSLVDRADFIIAHIKPTVASWGTADELFTANRMKKPIFLSVEGGKKACPLWMFGVIPHKYIYDSPDEILEMLKRIDSGKKKPDSSRWRLFTEEYR